jgi:polyhydroxyalkanoate synthesis regulator phasin
MPQPPDWKRVLETGMNFTEVRREQAHRIASDLVSQGQLARDQLGAAVDEIVDTSKRRSEEFRSVVRAEVHRQLRLLGLEGKGLEGEGDADDDHEAKLRTGSTKNGAKRAPAKKKAVAKKPAKKKAVAKKAAKKPAAKKPAKKKAVAKKAAKKPAKKATAKKPAATTKRAN